MGLVPFALPDVTEQEVDAVTTCLRSGWLTSGRKVTEFEQRFAEYVCAEHAIAVNSATAGALLIMHALGIGEGDEVIVPTYTFSGPAMMAHQLGATVKLVDCLPGSFQVDPDAVARAITSRTKLVMPTHFSGSACNIYALLDLCEPLGIPVVDDAAHAFPTRYPNNLFVGTGGLTKASFFSFYATKTLTTGEGGMITTNDEALAARIRTLRTHGFNRTIFDRYTNPSTGWRYDIADAGWKANLTDIAAAMGTVQLERSGDMLLDRQNIAQAYRDALQDVREVQLPADDAGSAWHLFPIRVANRDKFIKRMARNHIQCSVHFIPLHHHSYWQAVGVGGQFPHADAAFAEEASLPIFSSMTKGMVQQVIDAVLLSLEV